MKGTKERFDILNEMQTLIEEWVGYVDSLGNECAYTDSIIELIQKKAKDLD